MKKIKTKKPTLNEMTRQAKMRLVEKILEDINYLDLTQIHYLEDHWNKAINFKFEW